MFVSLLNITYFKNILFLSEILLTIINIKILFREKSRLLKIKVKVKIDEKFIFLFETKIK